MKYLIRNTDNNVITLVYEMSVQTSPPLELIEVADNLFNQDMLNSIFVDVNNYTPYPSYTESWWESDGTNWVDLRELLEVWDTVRIQRNAELALCDWTHVEDSPLAPAKKSEWAVYRTTLRDIPNANIDPRDAAIALNNAILSRPTD